MCVASLSPPPPVSAHYLRISDTTTLVKTLVPMLISADPSFYFISSLPFFSPPRPCLPRTIIPHTGPGMRSTPPARPLPSTPACTRFGGHGRLHSPVAGTGVCRSASEWPPRRAPYRICFPTTARGCSTGKLARRMSSIYPCSSAHMAAVSSIQSSFGSSRYCSEASWPTWTSMVVSCTCFHGDVRAWHMHS